MRIKHNYENNFNDSKYLYRHTLQRLSTNMNFNLIKRDLFNLSIYGHSNIKIYS